jgi:hypothetical protein
MLLKTLGLSLEELDLGGLGDALTEQFGETQKVGPSVVLLAISGDIICTAVFRNDIDFTHNTHLRSIRLGIFYYSRRSMNWLLTLLSDIVSPHVVHVLLRVQLGHVSALDQVDWAQIELVFTQERWKNLQKLTVEWYSPTGIPSEVEASIKACLPVLESRGKLAI